MSKGFNINWGRVRELKEFAQAAAASPITRYSYDGFEGITDCKTYRTLYTIASQLFADVTAAKMKLEEEADDADADALAH
ncbi:unnamed protein product [Nippostrongylus brasiliensis]|uniref:Kinesin motor domain-containing protein n=1 Tax=Nippostrongylus brasiliensis TaxID=27835 RepID=A0A0N4YYE1_NIPBR|nr:unnamed protein product [Nippostrongylus brasiliensis]